MRGALRIYGSIIVGGAVIGLVVQGISSISGAIHAYRESRRIDGAPRIAASYLACEVVGSMGAGIMQGALMGILFPVTIVSLIKVTQRRWNKND